MRRAMTYQERQEILELIQSGVSTERVAATFGRSDRTIRLVRAAAGIPALPRGRRITTSARPPAVLVDELEAEGTGHADPWIPPAGYDMYAERPRQRQWLAMLSAAGKYELVNLRHAVCRVLGLPLSAADAAIEEAVRADRRTAEELADRYLAARGGRVPG